ASRALAVATAVVLCLLALVSIPYMGRLQEQHLAPPSPHVLVLLGTASRVFVVARVDPVVALVAAGSVALVPWCLPEHRRAVVLGVAVVGSAFVLAAGPGAHIGDHIVPLPWSLVDRLPGSHAVHSSRFVVLGTVCLALLIGLGLDAIERLVAPRPVGLAVELGLVGIILWRCSVCAELPQIGIIPLAPKAPAARRWLASKDSGTVLDLLPARVRREAGNPFVSSADAMLGNLVHGLPVTALHSHYIPPGSALVMRRGASLWASVPAEELAQGLVDMADVRWILISPADGARVAIWLEVPGVTRAASFPDGEVLEIR